MYPIFSMSGGSERIIEIFFIKSKGQEYGSFIRFSLDFTDQYYNSGDSKGDDQIQNGGQAAFLGLVYVFLWIKIDTVESAVFSRAFYQQKEQETVQDKL